MSGPPGSRQAFPAELQTPAPTPGLAAEHPPGPHNSRGMRMRWFSSQSRSTEESAEVECTSCAWPIRHLARLDSAAISIRSCGHLVACWPPSTVCRKALHFVRAEDYRDIRPGSPTGKAAAIAAATAPSTAWLQCEGCRCKPVSTTAVICSFFVRKVPPLSELGFTGCSKSDNGLHERQQVLARLSGIPRAVPLLRIVLSKHLEGFSCARFSPDRDQLEGAVEFVASPQMWYEMS